MSFVHGKTSPLRIACILGAMLGIWVIIAMVVPPQGSVTPRAMKMKCASNLQYIAQGMVLYWNDHGVWPQTFAEILIGAEVDPAAFVCPSGDAVRVPGLGIQEAALSLADPKHCSFIYFPPPAEAGDLDPEMVVVVERPANHGGKGMNILFGDGHVEWLDKKGAEFVISELEAGHNPPRWPTAQPTNAPGKQ